MTKEHTLGKLLAIGNELMSIKGYHGVGLKEILDKASVPKGSFYYYFKSKEDFAIEVIKFNFAAKHRYLRTILEDKAFSPLQRLKNLISEYRKMEYKNDALLVKMITEMANLSAPIRDSLECGMNESKVILLQCLEDAQKVEEIGSSHVLPELCEFIFSSWEGALLRCRLTESIEPMDVYYRYMFDFILK